MASNFRGGWKLPDGRRSLSTIRIDEPLAEKLAELVELTGAPANHHCVQAITLYVEREHAAAVARKAAQDAQMAQASA
jgi:predicted transcriptional regulator